MGSTSTVHMWILLSLLSLTWGQELQERDALCNSDGCLVVYLQRKTFLDSWRSCKDKGGNLATVKRPEEAEMIKQLFSGLEPRGSRSRLRVWIGLQRQPRQCSATRPLRGFTWITGDQDTQFTNWLREDSPNTCAAPRCVVIIHSNNKNEQRDNFKWLDGSCTLPVDGFLCHYSYKGMCEPIQNQGGGPPLYTTPFGLLSTLLTHVPFGSVAAVPCSDGEIEDQSVLCMLRDDGTIGWSRDAHLCSDEPAGWCEQDNGGCEQLCLTSGSHYYCECSEGFFLAEDGQSCLQTDPCLGAACEFQCQPTSGSYRCTCPEGYLLAPDGHECLDIDECIQTPCPQQCVNAAGTFECRCYEGFHPNDFGQCEDIDECLNEPCAHECENTPGSYTCHCHLGFSPSPEDPSRCHDTNECQIPATCHQMCVNYEGGFECHCEEGYELQPDQYSCSPVQTSIPQSTPSPTLSDDGFTSLPDIPLISEIDLSWAKHLSDWLTDNTPHDWLTDPPALEWVTDVKSTADTTGLPTTTLKQDSLKDSKVHEWEGPKSMDMTKLTISSSVLSSTPASGESTSSSAATTEWFEEESTTNPSPPPTATEVWGAWHWFWYSSTPAVATESLGQREVVPRLSEVVPETQGIATSDNTSLQIIDKGVPGVLVQEGVVSDTKTKSFTTEHKTLTPPVPFIPVRNSAELPANGGKPRQDKSWLLVALLVPLSVFVVVMLALGIVYCTRCAVQPRNKSITDCYRWITNSKPEASVGGNTKSRA